MTKLDWVIVKAGRYRCADYEISRMSDNLWHLFDRKNSTEITLRGARTLRAVKAIAADIAASRS